MLASGDYNGFIEGCVAAELAIRILRKQAVPKEVILRTVVVDKSNAALRDAGREAQLPDRGRGRSELTKSPPSIGVDA